MYAVQSPEMLVTGIGFCTPTLKCGQYVQGHVRGPNNTDVEPTINSLYIGRNDNDSGHWVFKLDKKEQVPVNRVTVIPISKDFRQRIDNMGTSDDQSAGIQIPVEDGNLTIFDSPTPELDADSHASDESYKYPDDRLQNDVPLNAENINEGVLESKLQCYHFQGWEDIVDKNQPDEDNNNNNNDYVSVTSSASTSIHSANSMSTYTSSNNQMDIDVILTQNDDTNLLTTKEPKEVLRGLECTLKGGFWSQIGRVINGMTPDLAVNLDKFYWGDNNAIIGEEASTVLSVIVQYIPMEPSYVLGTMYHVEPNIIKQEQHASKVTPQ